MVHPAMRQPGVIRATIPPPLLTGCRSAGRNHPEFDSLLDIQVGYGKCILLDKVPTRLDLVSHQGGEDVI